MAKRYLFDVMTRHDVRVNGLAVGLSNKFDKFLQKIAADIRKDLANVDLTDFKQDRLERLLERVEADIEMQYDKFYYDVWKPDLLNYSHYEADFQAKKIGDFVKTDFDRPTFTQLNAAVMHKPLVNIAGAPEMKSFYYGWAKKNIDAIHQKIAQGFYRGTPTPEIVRGIIGTAKGKYKDGVMAQFKRDMMAVTRTAVNHASNQARQETYRANDDIIKGWEFCATFDSRTSLECQGLNGKIFKIGEGPMPPIHPNCRSTSIPVLDDAFAALDKDATRIARGADGIETIPANMNYYDWLKTQPDKFQDEALGATRGQLLRDGGLTGAEFQKLSLDKNFTPRTLDEIKELDKGEEAFDRAGIG